jgi:hypothetical protein
MLGRRPITTPTNLSAWPAAYYGPDQVEYDCGVGNADVVSRDSQTLEASRRKASSESQPTASVFFCALPAIAAPLFFATSA